MANDIPQHAKLQVPAPIVAQIQAHAISAMANAIVTGDYEGSEVIPASHKMIIGEMLLTLSRNRVLETAKCEHCSQIRLEHELDLSSGHRVCRQEYQPKASAEDPTLIPTKKRFNPHFPKIIEPTEADKRIIVPGR